MNRGIQHGGILANAVIRNAGFNLRSVAVIIVLSGSLVVLGGNGGGFGVVLELGVGRLGFDDFGETAGGFDFVEHESSAGRGIAVVVVAVGVGKVIVLIGALCGW